MTGKTVLGYCPLECSGKVSRSITHSRVNVPLIDVIVISLACKGKINSPLRTVSIGGEAPVGKEPPFGDTG